MKNNLISISIVCLALSIVVVGYSYLDVFKAKNNFNSIKVDSVETIDGIKPTEYLVTFNIDLGKYDPEKGPSFEQTSGAKVVVEKIKDKLKRDSLQNVLVSWNGGYPLYATTTSYKSGIRIDFPINNGFDEKILSNYVKEFNPESLLITKNVSDKEFENFKESVESKNLIKNRKQADEKAKLLKTKIVDVVSNSISQPEYGTYQPANTIIEENSDGTLKVTNYVTVTYSVAK